MDLLTKIWAETDRGEVSEIKREAYKDKYIYTPNFEKNKQLDAEDDFMNVVIEEREQAFKLGFNTAVRLFLASGAE